VLDPPTAEHLADCPSCGERYTGLVRFMDALRTEGAAEADAVFPPERLRLQHQQIVRRLEQLARPPRVISFPSQFVRRTITASTSRGASRWVAAAAAAGLFIGVALGASYEWNTLLRKRSPAMRSAETARVAPVATRGTSQPDIATDDAFLSDLEIALERPHTRELLAFDELTPHVREIGDNR
jgi:hypothetical protein